MKTLAVITVKDSFADNLLTHLASLRRFVTVIDDVQSAEMVLVCLTPKLMKDSERVDLIRKLLAGRRPKNQQVIPVYMRQCNYEDELSVLRAIKGLPDRWMSHYTQIDEACYEIALAVGKLAGMEPGLSQADI